MRLATSHPDWCLGFEDETWWSRLVAPAQHAWTEAGQPRRLGEQTVAATDPDPKALACDGLYLPATNDVLLRFVARRPVSALTTPVLTAWCTALAARRMTALLLVWDNAGWHITRAVVTWLQAQNRLVTQTGAGVRILRCQLLSRTHLGSIRSSPSGSMPSAGWPRPTSC